MTNVRVGQILRNKGTDRLVKVLAVRRSKLGVIKFDYDYLDGMREKFTVGLAQASYLVKATKAELVAARLLGRL